MYRKQGAMIEMLNDVRDENVMDDKFNEKEQLK